jgi:hypothetical protein
MDKVNGLLDATDMKSFIPGLKRAVKGEVVWRFLRVVLVGWRERLGQNNFHLRIYN